MPFITIAHAQEETHAEVEATPSEGVLASLGINGTLFVSQLINFAIVATVLWFMILKPLTKKMAERQKMIDESIKSSKKIEENLQKSEQAYQQRIDTAKVEANKILEKATAEAETVGETMKVKAKQEIETLVEHAKHNIVLEKEEMVAGLKAETADLIVAAIEKILAEKMDDTKDKTMIEEMLKNLKK